MKSSTPASTQNRRQLRPLDRLSDTARPAMQTSQRPALVGRLGQRHWRSRSKRSVSNASLPTTLFANTPLAKDKPFLTVKPDQLPMVQQHALPCQQDRQGR